MRVSIDPTIKRLIIRFSDFGFDARTISLLLDVSKRTVYRIRALWAETGDVVTRPSENGGAGRPKKLNASGCNFIADLIDERNDAYLDEFQEALLTEHGVSVSRPTLSRTLKLMGYTRKKITRQAIERDEVKRAAYFLDIGLNYKANQLVFVDESAVDRRVTYRTKGWSLEGTQAIGKGHFIRGKRFSVLPALSLSGVLDISIVEGSFNGVLFKKFITGLLDEMNPFPGPNSVVVMDNATIHKNPEIRDLIEERGMRLIYLPPYSPDFNPIEEAFSAVKAWIRRNGGFVREALTSRDSQEGAKALLTAVVHVMTPINAEGWFRDSGYVHDQEEEGLTEDE